MAKPGTLCEMCGGRVQSRKKVPYCFKCQFAREKELDKRRNGAETLKKKMIKESGEVCQRCGRVGDVAMHHIIPVSQGGLTTRENCILLCQNCHKQEHGGRGVGPATYNY